MAATTLVHITTGQDLAFRHQVYRTPKPISPARMRALRALVAKDMTPQARATWLRQLSRIITEVE